MKNAIQRLKVGDGIINLSEEDFLEIQKIGKANGCIIADIYMRINSALLVTRTSPQLFCVYGQPNSSVENPIPKEEFIKLITQETMKSNKITPPEGYEVYKDKSTFEEIVFKKIEKKYPTSVKEIDRPYFLDSVGRIVKFKENQTLNNFSTIERSKQILALIQLLELRDAWNKIDGFVANVSDENQEKWSIVPRKELKIECSFYYNSVLHFKLKETAQLFLDQFRELIEECKELI